MLTVIDEAVDHLEEWSSPAVVKPSPRWYTVTQLFRYGDTKVRMLIISDRSQDR